MIVSLDRLSSRYHQLPSIVLSQASTFDLYVMDIGIRYTSIAEQKKNGTYVKPVPELSQEEMLEIIARNRNGKS